MSMVGVKAKIIEEYEQLKKDFSNYYEKVHNKKKEFDAFKECLDYNDYRYDNCREHEKALHACWNKRMNYS